MRRKLNRVERFIRILNTLGSKTAAAYAVRNGLSCEGCIAAMRRASHA